MRRKKRERQAAEYVANNSFIADMKKLNVETNQSRRETSQPSTSDNTIPTSEELAIRAEVHKVMQKNFQRGRTLVDSNPKLHKLQ